MKTLADIYNSRLWLRPATYKQNRLDRGWTLRMIASPGTRDSYYYLPNNYQIVQT